MNTDDKPISVIRDSQICVSYTVRSALNYVSQALGMQSTDALANDILEGYVTEHWPTVMAHIKAKQDADKAFRAELKKQLGQPVPFAD